MRVTLSEDEIRHRKIRMVEAIQDMPSGHVKKGERVLAFHKMRIYIPVGGKYDAYEMDGQLFDHYFKDYEAIIMI